AALSCGQGQDGTVAELSGVGGGSADTAAGGTSTASGSSTASGGWGHTSGAGGVAGSGGQQAGAGGRDVATGGAMDEVRPTIVAAPGTTLVKVDVDKPHQLFEGWGTSLCWWAHHVGGWSEAARNKVVDAVVDPVAGLGYNIFRYNIGGGENPSHEHMSEHREMPGFQREDGSFTWDSDAEQRAVLLRIAEQTNDLVLEAFSNSPPYFMTESGCASGSASGRDNLKADYYDDFADYLSEVVLHYRDEYGVIFRTLEPLNEPFADWWKSNGSQEGCHFDPASQALIIRQVAQSLAEKGLTDTVVSASDENSMDDAVRNLQGFDAETQSLIGQLNVHSYAGTKRRELRALADQLGKRLWQSESGPLGQDISDDLEAALFMAGRIIQDLRELEAEAWVDWQAGDPSRSWASFTLNDSQQTFTPIKRFFMHAGFSRFIRPGAQLVDIDDSDMVAAVNKQGDALSIVVRNGSPTETRNYTLDLTSLRNIGQEMRVYRTSREEDLAQLDVLSVEDWSVVVSVPPASITSYVVAIP
ncbi:MAG TPA: glycoside hydrolase, partial [Polyangiaceae bacterium]|nr:glycoside hydrolase [Polyangiaceae bacterium]